MRPGGVPAGAGDPDRDLVAGGGDRADRVPILPTSSRGVAVQREDPVDGRDAARGQHVERAAGHLLGRLEDQPDPAAAAPGRGRRARNRPAPSRIVVCTSCPQAWQAFGTVDR